jgi:hypothetical protein
MRGLLEQGRAARLIAAVAALASVLGAGASAARADTTAPTLVVFPTGANGDDVGGVTYFRSSVVNVNVSTSDLGPGVASVSCLIDGVTQTQTSPNAAATTAVFPVGGDGVHTYRCSSTDGDGNATTQPSPGTFGIDATAPTPTVTTTPATGVGFLSVTVHISAVDLGTGVKSVTYGFAGPSGPGTTISGATADVTVVGPGRHTVSYSMRDNAGNVTTGSVDVYVDPVPPDEPTVDEMFVPAGSSYAGVLAGDAHDNVGVARVDVDIDDAIGRITYSRRFRATCDGCGTAGTTDARWHLDLSGRLPAAGNYIATITVTDLAGNVTTLRSGAIVVQTN